MTYTVFLCVASRHKNITMSAFVIWETTNNKRYSTQPVANSLNMKTYLQAVSQKRQTVHAKFHFIEAAFVQASIVGKSFTFRK